MSKTNFFSTFEMTIDGKTIPAGTRIATLETDERIDADRAIRAIAAGRATPSPVDSPAAAVLNEPEPAPAVAGAKGD